MSDEGHAPRRATDWRALRQAHRETIERTQQLLKEQQAFRKRLRAVLAQGEQTIPQIAAAAALPADQVLWYVMAMKKYGLVREAGKDGAYYRYELVEETG
jgi:predicted transcriptional regulator